MNPTDLRNIDYDAYRHRAAELRQHAINDAIDRLLAWATRSCRSRAPTVAGRCAAPTANCTA